MWKDFFYFSKRERQGILVLIALIAGIFLGKFLFTPKDSTPAEDMDGKAGAEIVNPEKGLYETTQEGSEQNPVSSTRGKPAGRYQKYDRPQENRTYYVQAEKSSEAPKQTSYPKTEKFPEGTIIELNASDTAQLIKIPGIGVSFAKRIVGYRTILGGYYRKEQLQEVYGMYEELYLQIVPYLQINSEAIARIEANTASIDKLKSHPYLNFYQAKAIVEMRKKKGKLGSIDELAMLEEFTEKDIERIRPYLAF
jgi:DNA uptake protein ComE-like DNA-binding protein